MILRYFRIFRDQESVSVSYCLIPGLHLRLLKSVKLWSGLLSVEKYASQSKCFNEIVVGMWSPSSKSQFPRVRDMASICMFGNSRTHIFATNAINANNNMSKFTREGNRSEEVSLFFHQLLAWPLGPSISIKDHIYSSSDLFELPALKMQPPALSYFHLHIAQSKCWMW